MQRNTNDKKELNWKLKWFQLTSGILKAFLGH